MRLEDRPFANSEPCTDRALIVYPVGVDGSAPKDFLEELASSLGAAFISRSKIFTELVEQGKIGDDPHHRQVSSAVRKIAAKELAGYATSGFDVIDPAYRNNSQSREPLLSLKGEGRKQIDQAGVKIRNSDKYRPQSGFLIALVLQTPTEVVIDRISQMGDFDSYGRHNEGLKELRQKKLDTNVANVEPIKRGEADLVLPINGALETPDLVSAVHDQIGRYSIIELETEPPFDLNDRLAS